MPEDIITVRLRRDHATFLDENLTRMAEHTRDTMKSPCLPKERRNADASHQAGAEPLTSVAVVSAGRSTFRVRLL